MSLKIVKKLMPCEFKWKDEIQNNSGIFDDKIHFGFIAQDVEKIFPKDKYGIVEKKDAFLMINYQEIIPFLVNAIQELEKKIKLLEEKCQ